MIWFACKQCGKRHGRAENLSGTLVFCECGHGNRVPWSSTVPEPPPEEAAPLPPPPPRAPRPPVDRREPEPAFPSLPHRPRERRRINPNYCLNHEDATKEATCDACHCSFCSACVVSMQGQTLCGPCKNFRFGGLSRPTRLPPLAIVAFVLALVGMVVWLILGLVAMSFAMVMDSGIAGSIVCCVLALLFAGGETVLSLLALRQIDRQPALGGRGLAMTGATAGLTGMLWAMAVVVFVVIRQVQG
jgi:hypothetical protein